MKVQWDDIEIKITDGYIKALETVMREEIKMMQQSEEMHSECWVWGECLIGDLADASSLEFVFGSEDDKPDDMTSDVRVILK